MRGDVKFWAFFLTALIISAVTQSSGQEQPDLGAGFKPYGSYDVNPIDSVNPENGNLIVHIPIPAHFPQRGGKLDPHWVLTTNVLNWQVSCTPVPNSLPFCQWELPSRITAPNFNIGIGLDHSLDVAVLRTYITDSSLGGSETTIGAYVVSTADGASHPLADVSGTGLTFRSIDTSAWRLDLTSANLNGTGVLTDGHGNRYQLNAFSGQPQQRLQNQHRVSSDHHGQSARQSRQCH